jgi:hypothetical protein
LLITTASPDRHRGPLPVMPNSWTSHSDLWRPTDPPTTPRGPSQKDFFRSEIWGHQKIEGCCN